MMLDNVETTRDREIRDVAGRPANERTSESLSDASSPVALQPVETPAGRPDALPTAVPIGTVSSPHRMQETPANGFADPAYWAPRAIPIPWRRPLATVGWGILMAVGSVSIALLLALAAAIPLVNFYVLGVLLDAEGRVARSGRFRDGFRLWGVAPRIGGIVLASWLFLLPVRFLASFASDAELVDPGGSTARTLRVLTLLLAVAAALHLLLSIARGGRLSTFFRPLKNVVEFVRSVRRRHVWQRWSDASAGFLRWFEFREFWWLGLKGYGVALAWIAVPSALYISAEDPEGGQIAVVFLGFLLLTAVNCWLPVLQSRVALTRRMRDGFHWRTARQQFNAAPWSWLLATVVLYLLTLPLHLFRIVLPPQDAAWLVTLIFVVTIYPTRVLLGWATYRGRIAGVLRHKARWYSRLPAKVLLVVFVAAYTGSLFLTQYIGTHGRMVLFEQHAFMLPWPL